MTAARKKGPASASCAGILSRKDSATVGSPNYSNGASPGRLLGGGLERDGWCFHYDVPGCDLTVTHFHGHRRGGEHQKVPSAARLVEVAEELNVLPQQVDGVLNPYEDEPTLAFAFINDDGSGVPRTVCTGRVRERARGPGP